MVTSHLRGHAIEFRDGMWVYSDTKEPTAESFKERESCGHCMLPHTIEDHDGCLGTLNGIMNACCGHGRDGDAYVQFLDKTSIHGSDAVTILNVLKKHKS